MFKTAFSDNNNGIIYISLHMEFWLVIILFLQLFNQNLVRFLQEKYVYELLAANIFLFLIN